MNERISQIIAALGIKKIEFAKRLGISSPFVSELCSGAKKASDRTIGDICREFNVNETWLRTGEGEMFVELPQNEALAAEIRAFLQGGTNSFRERLISLLIRLEPKQWEALEGYMMELVNPSSAPAQPDRSGQKQTGVDAGGQEQMEVAEELLPEEAEELERIRQEMIAKRGQTEQPSALPNASAS